MIRSDADLRRAIDGRPTPIRILDHERTVEILPTTPRPAMLDWPTRRKR
jgi:hypothetical protein